MSETVGEGGPAWDWRSAGTLEELLGPEAAARHRDYRWGMAGYALAVWLVLATGLWAEHDPSALTVSAVVGAASVLLVDIGWFYLAARRLRRAASSRVSERLGVALTLRNARDLRGFKYSIARSLERRQALESGDRPRNGWRRGGISPQERERIDLASRFDQK